MRTDGKRSLEREVTRRSRAGRGIDKTCRRSEGEMWVPARDRLAEVCLRRVCSRSYLRWLFIIPSASRSAPSSRARPRLSSEQLVTVAEVEDRCPRSLRSFYSSRLLVTGLLNRSPFQPARDAPATSLLALVVGSLVDDSALLVLRFSLRVLSGCYSASTRLLSSPEEQPVYTSLLSRPAPWPG